jgi:hypothetical protein
LKGNWMKLMLGLNILLRNAFDALQRRLDFKVSCFKFQVCCVARREFQCMAVNFLWRCKVCVPNNRDHLCCFLWTGSVLFMIYLHVGLLIVMWIESNAERFDLRSVCVSSTGLVKQFAAGCQATCP